MFVNICFMSVLCPEHSFHVRRYAVSPSASVRKFCACTKIETYGNEQEYSLVVLACPFSPVYLLLLFAIHSFDVQGSYVVQSVDGTWTYTTSINGILNERLTETHRVPAGFTPDKTNRQPNWNTKKTHRTKEYRIPTEELQEEDRTTGRNW